MGINPFIGIYIDPQIPIAATKLCLQYPVADLKEAREEN